MSNPQENQGAQSPNQAPNDEIARLLPALRALAKSVEKQMYSGMTEGTGALAVRQYRALHGRIAALLPDDYYITSVLALEGDAAGEPGGQQADDQAMIAQTHLLLQQLVTYLNQIVPPQRGMPPGTPPGVSNAGGGWQNFGRELNEQIAQLTRNTVRRALESIDFNVPQTPNPPTPPNPPQHVNVSGGSVFVQPPVPPAPPIPPNRPPNSPSGRIHIRVENGEDVFEREFPPRDVPHDEPPRGFPPQGVPPRDVPPPDVLFWRGNPPPADPPGDDEVV